MYDWCGLIARVVLWGLWRFPKSESLSVVAVVNHVGDAVLYATPKNTMLDRMLAAGAVQSCTLQFATAIYLQLPYIASLLSRRLVA